MTTEIKFYLTYLQNLKNPSKVDFEQILIRIQFYQHERLIHLIVTMSVAVIMILLFLAFQRDNAFWLANMALFVICLILTCFYLAHYYFLENSVQKMYTLYYQLLSDVKKR
ncbi:hypothetical protein AGMMS50249_3360 [candidate division SR1 bacterium]|nr:hypothetical protein AGMMS50249_3360 [candidate division SR1 bacterium]